MLETKQVFSRDESLPEVNPHAINSARTARKTKPRFPLLLWCSSKRVFLTVSVLAVVAIAVGLGVRFGFVDKGAQSKDPMYSFRFFMCTCYLHPRCADSTFASRPTISSPVPHGILNDTSIAAMSMSDGDRHIFFQDSTGTIRQAIYTVTTNQWASPLSLVVATDAKNNTPLAPVVDPMDNVIIELLTFQCILY